ncbi:Glycosyl hydrolase family 92 [Posidoniimonas polymericola]|uniref:Glycosyl hydrolase family 92 n=1 Tax=Posidoniimonas polymericola TaxID=2528002 RepID=A0A5C5YPE4_9BACT|nr:GH92 family glycosyl hydrolase [Posidoniimonas polymericola]TWT76832.1 Glycosyl hydrolase family 92 [Posidoniimonas polymericola]
MTPPSPPRVVACLLAALALSPATRAGEPRDLVRHVNTLQGTNSRFELTRGNTYPTCALPFGMHTWTPQTGHNGDGWKYQYHRDQIRGFQQAHQCSSWSNDYAVFSLMPVVGELVVDENARASRFRHDDEVGKPHYYRVTLENGVEVEISPTVRGAMLRFRFPPDQPAHLVLDGYLGRSKIRVDDDQDRLVGWVRNGRNQPRGFVNHFLVQFDTPVESYGAWRGGAKGVSPGQAESSGNKAGAYVTFAPGSVVQAKVASSYVSAEQAALTLDRELGRYDQLEEVKEAAAEVWNQHLAKLTVEGGPTERLETFYSCYFRASLFPRKFYERDAEGEAYYRSPYDGEVHRGYLYTDTGLWDTFRAQMPLNALLYPQMHGRYMQALLAAHRQCGWLPSWSFPGEAGSMIGNHAISLLADAWAKGIRTFDPAEALAAYDHESSHKGPWGPANGRGGADVIERIGYLPYPEFREATAKTLEYAYDDFCGYWLAKQTGDEELAEKFAKRMYNYRHVFDGQTGFMRGRDAEGGWAPNFDPIEWGGPYTEGSAWHWVWSVFHDPHGLGELLGGDDAFVEKLDAVFAAPAEFKPGTYGAPIHEMREMVLGQMGQYAHGNQPIQHMPYLYCYAGQPWKTQRWVREVMQKLYNATEDGYPGDEDQGQTSSWFVQSALGFYSVCPGVDQYVLGSPAFEKATLRLENGKRFVVEAPGNSAENVYIQAATLNGAPLDRNYLTHDEIVQGGVLRLEMGPQPNLDRGVGVDARPFSVSTADRP